MFASCCLITGLGLGMDGRMLVCREIIDQRIKDV
jgi:hypothetical protein